MAVVPSAMKVKVIASPERKYSAWIGKLDSHVAIHFWVGVDVYS